MGTRHVSRAKTQPVQQQEIKLDLGCGPRKREGFIGVDAIKFEGVDWRADLKFSPWKFAGKTMPFGMKKSNCERVIAAMSDTLSMAWWTLPDNSVNEVHCSHFLEHLTGAERVTFFNELYRVMKKDGKATIIVPSWTSERAYGDPTHQWPPVCGMSFFYLDKNWRAANAPHCGYECDFQFVGGNSIGQPWNLKTQEVQAFAQTHYLNVAVDMHVTLTRR